MANLVNLNNGEGRESRIPEAYHIDSINLRTHDGMVRDIQQLVTDFTITESIYYPGLVFSLNIKDSINFMEEYRLTGHETIVVNLSRTAYNMEATSGERTDKNLYPDIEQSANLLFYVTEYPLYAKFDNRLQVYTLKGVSKHIFLSKFKKISRAYTGSIANFIKDVFEKDLDVDSKNIVLSKQASPKVSFIVPNLAPLDAIQWAIRHCYDEKGSPWYFYETLQGKIVIESHMDVNARAVGPTPYREYREGKFFENATGSFADFYDRACRILNLVSDVRLSKLLSGQNGAYGSKSIYTDIFNKSITTDEFNYEKEFSKMAKIGNYSSLSDKFYPEQIAKGISFESDYSFYDRAKDIKAGAFTISKFSDANINYIPMNSGAFGTSGVNYHNPTKNKFINIAQSVSENLDMMVHDFTVTGDLELNCGKIVSLLIAPASDPEVSKTNSKTQDNPEHDEFFSGRYVVVSIIHRFAETYFCDVRVKTDAFSYNLLK